MDCDNHQKNTKLTIFFSLMVVFAVFTLIGGILVIRFRFNTLYSLIPALCTIVFSVLCRNVRKKIQASEKKTNDRK